MKYSAADLVSPVELLHPEKKPVVSRQVPVPVFRVSATTTAQTDPEVLSLPDMNQLKQVCFGDLLADFISPLKNLLAFKLRILCRSLGFCSQ